MKLRFDIEYFLDTNAIAEIGRTGRKTLPKLKNVAIPQMVLFECRGFEEYDDLLKFEYKVTAGVLQELVNVLEDVPLSDTSILDLYQNKGNADPFLIASVLDYKRRRRETLFHPKTLEIVTRDKAVSELAHKFNLSVMSPDDYKVILGILD